MDKRAKLEDLVLKHILKKGATIWDIPLILIFLVVTCIAILRLPPQWTPVLTCFPGTYLGVWLVMAFSTVVVNRRKSAPVSCLGRLRRFLEDVLFIAIVVGIVILGMGLTFGWDRIGRIFFGVR